jgi:hypothetical protein
MNEHFFIIVLMPIMAILAFQLSPHTLHKSNGKITRRHVISLVLLLLTSGLLMLATSGHAKALGLESRTYIRPLTAFLPMALIKKIN